jgi:hypothetical protein
MKSITLSILSLLCVLLFPACKQLQETATDSPAVTWPEESRQTKPWSRWWWQGSGVTKAGITAELEAYKAAGLGGLELTPIYGVIGEEGGFIDYLSPEWMDMLEYTLQEAERLDLGIDMATGTGWPFGGPWIDAEHACKYLEHKTYKLEGGQGLQEAVTFSPEPFVRAVTNQVYQLYGIYKEKGEPVTGSMESPELLAERKPLGVDDLARPISANKNLQELALDQVRFADPLPLQTLIAYSEEGQVVNLTDKVDENGQLDWTAPAGSWTLYALFQGLHGKMVERAAPGGEGNVIDHFSTPAIQHYLSKFDSAFAGRDISTLRAFFNDSYEVDDARGQANWTPGFLASFKEKRGYDLQEHFPALFGEGSEDEQARVLSDFRETFSDLLLETFTQKWDSWAESKGKIIRNQSHGSPANILDLYAASDIPETEGTDVLRIKFATSAAHVSGKPLASAEAATWLDEHFLSNLSTLKENLDRYLIGGVNHLLFHGTCYSPPGDEWPGRLFYAAIHANYRNSLWHDFPALNAYISRAQSFLQAGQIDNDVLLYFPAYDRYATPGRELLDHFDGHGPRLEGTAVEQNAHLLQEEGFAYDLISDRQILQLQVADDLLTTGGTSYQVILVPETRFMPMATFAKLIALAREGATVIFHKELPASIPGLHDLASRKSAFQAAVDDLQFIETGNGVRQASVGQGAFVIGAKLDELLRDAGVEREPLVYSGLEYIRRKTSDGRYYFISNWSESPVAGWVTIRTEAPTVIIFDPMTGQYGRAATRNAADGRTEVYLHLMRGNSCILQTTSAETDIPDWPNYEPGGEQVALNGPWSLSFIAGGPELPASREVASLGSWTDDPALTAFSGTGVYTITFPRPAGEAAAWVLDLGQVNESAEVKLNDKVIGTLLGPDYQVIIPADQLAENNTLEIAVSNLMANRIADMDKKGVFWKKFYNVNFPPRRAENRGRNGLFDASGWEPLPSGLSGPVTLTPMKVMHPDDH